MEGTNRRTELDILRCLAMVAVIMLHTIGAVFYKEEIVDTSWWMILNIINSGTRWCVPAFVMISGTLFLNPEKEVSIRDFFKKYIPRLLIAFLVWSSLYTLYDMHSYSDGMDCVHCILEFAISTLLKPHYHLWYIYMIVGLYIITPILRIAVKGMSEKVMRYWLILMFMFGLLVPVFELSNLFNRYCLEALGNLNLGFLSGFVFYYVAGYYLYKYPIKYKHLFYVLGILSYIVTVVATYGMSMKNGIATTLYDPLYPNTALIAIAIFIVFQQFQNYSFSAKFHRFFGELAQLMLGVYFIHDFVLILFRKVGISLLYQKSVGAVFGISGIVFVLSCAVVILLRKVTLFRKYLT